MIHIPRSLKPSPHAFYPALLAIVVYAGTLQGGYVYDDMRLLVEDPRLRDPSQWVHYFDQSYNFGIDNLYRPLTSMSYAVQWWLHGERPWAFHLGNVLLHAAVTGCVAEFARRLLGGNWVAGMIAGLLFAVHPIHVEAVANVAGRPELVCGLGTFGALLLFLKPITIPRAFAVTGCAMAALLGKEQGLVVPLLLLVLFTAQRWSGARTGPEPGIRWLATLLGVTLVSYLLWREWILTFNWDRSLVDWTVNPMIPSGSNPLGGSVGRHAWLMPIVLLGRYTALLIAPVRLSPDYGGRVIGAHAQLHDPYLYVGMAAILALAAVLVFSIRRRSPAGIFLGIALALTFAMVGNFISYIGTIFGERLMYIPSGFLLVLVAVPLSRLSTRPLLWLMAVLLLAGTWRTISYARLWNDPVRLFEVTGSQKPQSVKLQILLAHHYLINQDFDNAERAAARARAILPEYPDVWVRSAMIAMEQKNWDQARQYLEQGSRVDRSGYVQSWLAELTRRRALDAPATQP